MVWIEVGAWVVVLVLLVPIGHYSIRKNDWSLAMTTLALVVVIALGISTLLGSIRTEQHQTRMESLLMDIKHGLSEEGD